MPGHPARPVQVTARQGNLQRKLVRGTKTPQRLAQRAQIVLLGAGGRSSEDIVEQMAVTRPMVRKWRRRWSQAQEVVTSPRPAACRRRRGVGLGGAESDLRDPGRRTRSGRPPDILPEQILEIIAIACEDPDTAQRPISHWTPGEVAREAVRRGIIKSISTRSVDRFLKGGRP